MVTAPLSRDRAGTFVPSVLHTGATPDSPEDALDTACGLYLNDATAWTTPPKD